VSERDFSIIGKDVIRVDGYEKVTGRARFGADLVYPGMLHGAVLRSEVPHGNLTRIDVNKAAGTPGVMTVLTAEDIPGINGFGVIVQHQRVFASERIRYQGDGLAMVVATTEQIARDALPLIDYRIEELPGIFTPGEALAPGAPLLHPDTGSNLIVHYPLRKGDVTQGMKDSDLILEREYNTSHQEHAYIEPEALVALPGEGRDDIIIHGSIQNVYSLRRAVARVLGVPQSKVRVIQSHMGGSFGGKDESMSLLACRAALAARATGKPVRMVNQREESLVESYKRHPYRMRYRVGATSDGKLQAMEVNILADGGAYASMSLFVTWRSLIQATGPYVIPNVKTDVRAAYTNNVYTGAFRGFGSPQVIFAQEQLMDELALELGISPYKLRRLNGYRQGDATASGQTLSPHRVSLHQVMREAEREADYSRKQRSFSRIQKSTLKRGIGMAVSYRGCSLGAEGVDAPAAIVTALPDGSVTLLSGLTENGQGLKTAFAQIAAEVFGLSLERVRYLQQDTDYVADSGPTVASRSTLMGGSAVKQAAEAVRKNIAESLLTELNAARVSEVIFRDGLVYHVDNPAAALAWEDAVNKAFFKGVELAAYGWYQAPTVHFDEETGQGEPYFTYVYGCQIAEVEVDISTGKVNLLRMTAAHDVGRVINRQGVLGQIYGGVVQGAGYALMEDINLKQGVIRNRNFDEYLIPTSLDLPHITPLIIENPDRVGPWGAKSIGEPAFELAAPAIANAVAQATGKRLRDLPLDLERVFLGHSLFAGKQERGSASAGGDK
jgi:CO/xanthine dehydrogenase Mo-binding subunit